jgi:hypothetical protein
LEINHTLEFQDESMPFGGSDPGLVLLSIAGVLFHKQEAGKIDFS